MKKMFFTLFLGMLVNVNAQNYVDQVYVLNEGYYDYATSTIVEPVTLGSYDPTTQIYSVVDTLEGMRFASDMVIEGDFLFVAADSKIYRYNKLTNLLINETTCVGVRNLAVYQNKLVATRGEYLTVYNSYLHVYDATTLQLTTAFDAVSGPQWASQNIVIDGDKAYVAVNNGFDWGNEKGIIGILDLTNLTYGNEIDLGPDGKNPDNLVKYGTYLYSVNNKDWSGSSISKIDMLANSATTSNLSMASTGCGTSCLRGDKILYQISGDNVVNEFDFNLMNNNGPVVNLAMNYYEIAEETVNSLFYASTTDFTTYGKVYIYNTLNVEQSNFDAGVSPGTIVFDVRSNLGMNELSNEISIFPNPSSGLINVKTNQSGILSVHNMIGQQVYMSTVSESLSIDLSEFGTGLYVVSLDNGSSQVIERVIVK